MVNRQTNRQTLDSSQNLESVIDSIANRYDRQELIEGWKQKKLTDAKIVVSGGDIVAQYTVMALAALGFGNIEIYSKKRYLCHTIQNTSSSNKIIYPENSDYNQRIDYSEGFIQSDSPAESIAEFAKKLNPLVNAQGIALDTSRKSNLSVLSKPSIVIDASNSSASKKELADYCIENGCLFISVSSADNVGKLGVYSSEGLYISSNQKSEKLLNNLMFKEMDGEPQDIFAGMTVSALAADEARKYVMPMQGEKLIEDVLIHNMHSRNRFDAKNDLQISLKENLSDKSVLMIGAGALGNFVGLGLSMSTVGRLTIIDKDIVESTNLNRQPFFYDSVGQEKVPALINKLRKINPTKTYEGVVEFIGLGFDKYFSRHKPDLIIDCVDNDKTRALLNYYSQKYRIPLISSATRYNSGHMNVSVPGKTSCLNCQREIDKYALDGEQARAAASHSCIYAPQASVITSNMVVAGMVISEAKSILAPKIYGEPIVRELKYISGDEFRIGTLPLNKDYCECFKDDKKIRNWPDVMGHLYSGHS